MGPLLGLNFIQRAAEVTEKYWGIHLVMIFRTQEIEDIWDALAYVDALGLADPVGTVRCDGKGGFKILHIDPAATRGYTQQHGQFDDFKTWAPDICKGAPENYAPGGDLDRMSKQSYSSDPNFLLQRSECSAYRKLLQCDSQRPGADAQVKRDRRELQLYKCDAWAW